jgi:midasin
MWKLLSHAFKNKEPVLFIGETGTGKTTVCQMYAAQHGQHIKILNCHQSTETADIIGGLRPIRNREGILKNIENDIKDLYLNLTNKFVSIKDKIEQDLSSFFLKSLNLNYSYSHDELTSAFDILFKIYDDNVTGSSPVKKLKTSEVQSNIEEDCKKIKESFVKYSSMFEWFDGPLVTSMKEGHIFVLDEINLAEDAIIERLNSVLESNREITLAEKGGYDSEKIVAHPNFRLVATMNPSGDFGKRELSPALRSRFTEIWVPSKITRDNISPILVELLDKLHEFIDPNIVANQIVDFIENINSNLFSNYDRFNQIAIKITIRDIINWANFINGWFENYQESCSNRNPNLGSTVENSALYYIYFSIVHAAEMIFLDGIGNLSMFSSSVDIQNFKDKFLFELLNICPAELRNCIKSSLFQNTLNNNLILNPSNIMFGAFKIERFIISDDIVVNNEFVLTSNNSKINFGRLLRAMQLTRPILLEGFTYIYIVYVNLIIYHSN